MRKHNLFFFSNLHTEYLKMFPSDRQNWELNIFPDEHGGFHRGKMMWVDELVKSEEKKIGKWSLCMVQIHLGTWADYLEGKQGVMLMGRKHVQRGLCCVKMQCNFVSQLSLFSPSLISPYCSCPRLGIQDTVLGIRVDISPQQEWKGQD